MAPPPVMLYLLLMVFCSLSGSHSSPTESFGLHGAPSEDPGIPPVDYYEGEDPTSGPPKVVTLSPGGRTLQRCDYSPCLEEQPPCEELAASMGCLCPGFTLYTVAPQAPDIKSVWWNGSEVVLRWCAPYSFVTAYVVTAGGQVRQTFGPQQRSGSLGVMEEQTQVCVLALNEAGRSQGSCATFRPPGRGLPLTAGLVGGALGLLVLVLLGVLLWRHRKQRKHEVSVTVMDRTETL
ncbi:leucine-rich repeat neuronal protein 4 [Gouania willdenowi]|uniref:Leucine-rich repeat neuronal protein 4-like n=1 Tax=Gouania willdenowi TaxID=441366 RepID=A0A8C5ERG9_GOUWI|nr:leucine-rich repeat neuronal protein 4-like [Gouania willdenowi]